jgi:hypothetical protein
MCLANGVIAKGEGLPCPIDLTSCAVWFAPAGMRGPTAPYLLGLIDNAEYVKLL